MASTTKPPFGVYTPLVTFFNDDESIDIQSTKAHIQRMAEGMARRLISHMMSGKPSSRLPAHISTS